MQKIPTVGDIFISRDNESEFKAKVILTHNIAGNPLTSYQMQVIDRIPSIQTCWPGDEKEKRKDIRGLPFAAKAETFWKNFKPI